jgi:hypothetical protein
MILEHLKNILKVNFAYFIFNSKIILEIEPKLSYGYSYTLQLYFSKRVEIKFVLRVKKKVGMTLLKILHSVFIQ